MKCKDRNSYNSLNNLMFLKEMFVAMYHAIDAKLADIALGKLN